MSIYTLHHQVRRLDETLCDNGRKYSTENVLFSGRGKRILLGKLIAEAVKVPSSLPIPHRNHLSLRSSTTQLNGCTGISRRFG